MSDPTKHRPSLERYLVRPAAPVVAIAPDRTVAILPEERKCPTCTRSVQLVINRRGHTRCVSCDAEAFLEVQR